MTAKKVWQIVMTGDDVDGLKYPLVLGWEQSKLNVLSVVMSGDYFHHIQLEQVEDVDAMAVKRGLAQMYDQRNMARMSEAIRGLQSVLETKIDAWFANQG